MEFDDNPTDVVIEIVQDDPTTSKHHSLAYLGGREKGFTEGVEAVMKSVGDELRRLIPNITNREIAVIQNRLREKAKETG